MSGISKKLMGTTAAGGGALAIEDVFSTYLYTGNGSTQTITNGIDLAGEGGLVWIKDRVAANSHWLFDTDRGATNGLKTNDTAANTVVSTYLTAFNSDGFSLSTGSGVNQSPDTYASWSWRKAPRFFDCVTYTGDGVAGRTVSHNLGQDVGSIFVKKTSSADAWAVWHRGANGGNALLVLNATSAQNTNGKFWWGDNITYIAPTSTEFTVATDGQVNAAGATYVAYLFAHDPLGPSGDGSDGLIACGSFALSGGTASVDLGWEPQFVLVKQTDGTGNWFIHDNMRGMALTADASLSPNTSSAEATYVTAVIPNATGFVADGGYFPLSGNYIYIAIRRGPMRAPTSGTEVFDVDLSGGTAPRFESSFPVDMAFWRPTVVSNTKIASRLTGTKSLLTNDTSSEDSAAANVWDFMDGFYDGGITSNYAWMFRRAPGFFDVVAYTGTGSARTVPHNLGVAPELIIVKARQTALASNDWWVNCAYLSTPSDDALRLNFSTGEITGNGALLWNSTVPTNENFSLGSYGGVNTSGVPFIAYLFATLPGVSKVGSYTGTGAAFNVDCGFTTGARFVLIKKTNNTGDWGVFDTARGITESSSPLLRLNNTTAEANFDYLDPYSGGFAHSGANATFNASGDTYIFLAIA